jgi:hypothetical protein
LSASKHTRGFDGKPEALAALVATVRRNVIFCPMETPQTKSEIIQAIQDLPDDATLEDAMERLYFLAKIERGLNPRLAKQSHARK